MIEKISKKSIGFITEELDEKDTYIPDLQDVYESAKRTYGEANAFFRKEELYLKDVQRRLEEGELEDKEDIYDECHAIASGLAECCEMYLKALFIFEHNMNGVQIDDIWNKLKNSDYKVDDRGQLLYKTPNGIITFAKYDDDGETIKDVNGKIIYFDESDNTYTENTRGAKIKRNGHQLDRLIDSLSIDSRLLLESRMLSIPMNLTEKNRKISILDCLQNKGIVSSKKYITQEQYIGWIEQHKKTFEECRYSGQRQYDVRIAFMYHLTTQIKAVAQYKINPRTNQQFTITDDELLRLPSEIQQLVSFRPDIVSEELLKLIANSNEIREKTINIFSQKCFLPNDITSQNFLDMIKLMNADEIEYVLMFCYAIEHPGEEVSKKIYNIMIGRYSGKKTRGNMKNELELKAGKNLFVKISPNTIITFINKLKSLGGSSFIVDKNNLILIYNFLKSMKSKEFEKRILLKMKNYELCSLRKEEAKMIKEEKKYLALLSKYMINEGKL